MKNKLIMRLLVGSFLGVVMPGWYLFAAFGTFHFNKVVGICFGVFFIISMVANHIVWKKRKNANAKNTINQ